MHTETVNPDDELKISVRLKGKLAGHVKKCTEQDGLFDNKGEYIRYLIRKDLSSESAKEDQLDIIWEHLLPGASADESAFEPVSLAQIQRRGREKATLSD